MSNCVNEILCQGAEPLFFLDTYTTGKLDTNIAAKVIEGIVKGCKESGCVLIGKFFFFWLTAFFSFYQFIQIFK